MIGTQRFSISSFQLSQRFQDVDRPHDVGFPSFHWFAVGEANERLRCEVENKIRLRCEEGSFDRRGIPHVVAIPLDPGSQTSLLEEGRSGWRGE